MTSTVPLENLETLTVEGVVNAMHSGALLRSAESIGWLAAGPIPNSLYCVPFFYLNLEFAFLLLFSFLFVVSV